jgi:hypothetical protein
MPNSIQLKAPLSRPPEGMTAGDVDQRSAWCLMGEELRKFEAQICEYKNALEVLPDSSDKDTAMFGLTVALDAIRIQMSYYALATTKCSGRPD